SWLGSKCRKRLPLAWLPVNNLLQFVNPLALTFSGRPRVLLMGSKQSASKTGGLTHLQHWAATSLAHRVGIPDLRIYVADPRDATE
ncbi:MAG: hypothetical protein ACREYC_25730, partial [Gammaproteobacteria bacterium]